MEKTNYQPPYGQQPYAPAYQQQPPPPQQYAAPYQQYAAPHYQQPPPPQQYQQPPQPYVPPPPTHQHAQHRRVRTHVSTKTQLRALLLKNAMVQARQKKTNACQVCFPVLLILLLALLNYFVFQSGPTDNIKASKIAIEGQPIYNIVNQSPKRNWNNVFFSTSNPTATGNLTANHTGSGLLGMIPQYDYDAYIGYPSVYVDAYVPYFTEVSSADAIDSFFLTQWNLYLSNYSYLTSGKVVTDFPTEAVIFNTLDLSPSAPVLDITIKTDADNYPQSYWAPFQLPTPNGMEYYNSYYGYDGTIIPHLLFTNIISSAFAQALANITIQIDNIFAMSSWETINTDGPFFASAILNAIFLPLGLSFLIPVFLGTIVREKQDGLVEMSKMMGMKMSNYWLSHWIFDYSLYLFVLLAFVIVGVVCSIPFFTETTISFYLLGYLLWGNTQIAMCYFLSTLFQKYLTSQIVGYMISIFGALIGIGLNFIPELLDTNWPCYIFMIYPQFAFSRVVWLTGLPLMNNAEPEWNTQMTIAIVYLLVEIPLYLLLASYFDAVLPKSVGKRLSPCFCLTCTGSRDRRDPEARPLLGPAEESTTNIQEDADCSEERRVIYQNHIPRDNLVLIKDIHHEFAGTEKKVALQKFCLTVQENECFGLLGPNGAGKTTLISILCGLLRQTSGNAWIDGKSVGDQIQDVHQILGVCQQFDLLWDDLTVAEHLLYYSRLKGVPKEEEIPHVRGLIESVGLEEAHNKLALDLSGGMKRRLSVAIALVGDPKLVLLDEPTTGLDPASKRNLWDVVMKAKAGRSIILTTHSMEEADALCTRIGIMSRGALRCLGTQLHLKSKFGEGFRLSVSFDPSNKNMVHSYVTNLLPSAELVNHYGGNAAYRVPARDVNLADLFSRMETQKTLYGIKYWSISQASLEEVFLRIVREDESAADSGNA